MMIPSGIPMTVPSATAIVDCHATVAASLSLGEPERLQQGQVTSTATDGCNKRQREGDDSSHGEGPAEEGRNGPDGSVIGDFSRPQDPDQPADTIGAFIER